jgi:methionyl-tRNA formyltransferase
MDGNKVKIKIIFIGAGKFALPIFSSLAINSGFEVAALITRPDRLSGRGLKISSSPIKDLAVKKNILVLQPEKINEIGKQISEISPQILVVASYGQILPDSVLSIPKRGAVNVHASLLPKYRGAACVPAAILNGDDKTGVTIMLMDKNLDTGPVLAQAEIKIEETDTAATLEKRLSLLASALISATLIDWLGNKIIPVPQSDTGATYAPRLKKEDGRIDWTKPVDYIARFIRAMNMWPGAFSVISSSSPKISNKIFKILSAASGGFNQNSNPAGTVVLFGSRLAVQCLDGLLILGEVQLEGKKNMAAVDFYCGNKEIIKSVLN